MTEARKNRLLAERTALYIGADSPTNWLLSQARKFIDDDFYDKRKTLNVIIDEYLWGELAYEEDFIPEDNWEYPVFILQHRIDRIFRHVTTLRKSRIKKSREIAVLILSQSSVDSPRISSDCVKELRALLASEKEPRILALAIFALYRYREVTGVVDLILSFASHADNHVGQSVARCMDGLNDPRCLRALIALSFEPDYETRLPATKGLASTIGRSNPDEDLACEALVERLTDPALLIRCVALKGLAKALDPRIIPVLLEKRNQKEAEKKEWLPALEAVMETLIRRRAELGSDFAPLMKGMDEWIVGE